MLVRVIQREDGGLSILTPVVKDDETAEEAVARYAEQATARNPALAGRPFVDVDTSALPDYDGPCAECDGMHPTRDRWSLVDGSVVVDERVPDLHAALAHARQRQDDATAQLRAAYAASPRDADAIAEARDAVMLSQDDLARLAGLRGRSRSEIATGLAEFGGEGG